MTTTEQLFEGILIILAVMLLAVLLKKLKILETENSRLLLRLIIFPVNIPLLTIKAIMFISVWHFVLKMCWLAKKTISISFGSVQSEAETKGNQKGTGKREFSCCVVELK